MAVITSAQSGNFTNTATWVGGVVPGVGDEAVAATGHVVAIDADITLNEVRQAGTGKFTLGGGRTLTANVQINAGTFASGGTVEVTAGTGTTATIVGNVAGAASSTLVNQAGVVMNGVGVLVVNGTVTGTAGSVSNSVANACAAVYTNVNSTINVLNAVTGGGTRKYGVYVASSGTSAAVTITGNVTGGSGVQAFAVSTTGASASLVVNGTVTGSFSGGSSSAVDTTGVSASITINGNVVAGGNSGAGVSVSGTSSLLTVNGTVTGPPTGASSGYGIFSTGNSASITIVGDVTGGAGSNGQGVFLNHYSATAIATLSITGNVTGGSIISGSNCHGLVANTGNTSITITGNVTAGLNGLGANTGGTLTSMVVTGAVTGGAGSNVQAMYHGSGPLAITGNITGGTALNCYGVQIGSSVQMTVIGNITGGTGVAAYGVYGQGVNSLVTSTGDITATSPSGNGIRSEAASSGYGVLASGSFTDSPNGTTAIYTRFMRIIETSPSGITRYANNLGFPSGTLVSRVSADLTTGMPAAANVRKSTTYGYNNELTGTLAVPPTNAVGSGVPVDGTVGTAALSPSDVAALVGAQIAAALDSAP